MEEHRGLTLFYGLIVAGEGTKQELDNIVNIAEQTNTLCDKPRQIDTTLFWYCHSKNVWSALGAYMVGDLK